MDRLKEYLVSGLGKKLPGKDAHQEAAPYRKVNYETKDLGAARKSAVLILLYFKKDEPYINLIQRPVYEGTHSGQIAFPGGKEEDTDSDMEFTALREANEEVGVIIEDVQVLGQLTEVYIPVSNFLVAPFVGIINYTPKFIPDAREVEEVLELKLADLINFETLIPHKISLEMD